MTIQDDFSQWFANYRASLTLSSWDCLAADLALRISEDLQRYRLADALIKADVAYCQNRTPGKYRLCLPLEELKRYMQARADRKAAQLRLSVMVPLARRVKIAKVQWRSGEPAPASALDAAVWLVSLTLPYHAHRQTQQARPPGSKPSFGYGEKVQRELAAELVRDHPQVFYTPAPSVSSSVPSVSRSTPKNTGVAQAYEKESLCRKILSTMILNAEEQRLLKAALGVTVS